jgi:uncharacterized protein (TIGR04255 family)
MAVVVSREIYPNAPAALVAVEIRHTTAAPLTTHSETAIKEAIAESFPLFQPLNAQGFALAFGMSMASAPQQPPPRFTNRDRTTAVTFGTQAIVVETTSHRDFASLNSLVELVARARQTVAPVDGLERIGLRYIDEIRVPEENPIDWAQWVNPALLGPTSIASNFGLTLAEHQAIVRFEASETQGLTIAYGPREGFAVGPAPLVRSPMPPAGPFFLLDVDSFWTAAGSVPEFETLRLVAKCEELHHPVHELFEALITERLREEVLRHA